MAEKTIEELCRPLSAKVMPDLAMWGSGGRRMTPEKATQAQRKAGHDARGKRPARKKKGKG